MSKSIIRFTLLCAGVMLYHWLFWQQKLGINLPVFTLALMLFYFLLDPQSLRSRNVQITVLATFLLGIPVVIFNTGVSVFAQCLSFLIMLGFAHQPALRSVLVSLANTALTWLSAPLNYIEGLGLPLRRHNGQAAFWYTVRRSVIPLAVCLVFYVLYSTANFHFKEFSLAAWDFLFSWLRFISVAQFFFLALGAIIVTGTLYRRELTDLVKGEASAGEILMRRRKKYVPDPYSPNTLPIGFRKEYRTALWLLIMVNILLLTVNIIDIRWVWFSFDPEDGFSLKQFVHEGTTLLILSILLSMGILIYFFRYSMNFFSRNKEIKMLAYIWVAQNFILCVSVFLRNYHYIQYHGLAYKRIGVIFFLILTAIGLYTLYRKISGRKTSFYLWRVNSWAAYALMLFAAFFNWNIIIAKYNLSHDNPGGIDTDFYLEMSPVVLPLLYENMPAIERQIAAHAQDSERWTNLESLSQFKELLDYRAGRFLEIQSGYRWPSWNLAEGNAYRKLTNVPVDTPAGHDKSN